MVDCAASTTRISMSCVHDKFHAVWLQEDLQQTAQIFSNAADAVAAHTHAKSALEDSQAPASNASDPDALPNISQAIAGLSAAVAAAGKPDAAAAARSGADAGAEDGMQQAIAEREAFRAAYQAEQETREVRLSNEYVSNSILS